MSQQNLFDGSDKSIEIDYKKLILFALGEFQSRGKELINRELPFDRLRGAFRRAGEHFKYSVISDEDLARELEKLKAKIVRVPTFVAKHPFRVTVDKALGNIALEFYQDEVRQTETPTKNLQTL
ncbi:MAG: hypothetical protein H7Z37_01260 [Pyrinomonadaceae bacterium]|nr:hypothetical protein [Pyrinomonadaceae bacterium]